MEFLNIAIDRWDLYHLAESGGWANAVSARPIEAAGSPYLGLESYLKLDERNRVTAIPTCSGAHAGDSSSASLIGRHCYETITSRESDGYD